MAGPIQTQLDNIDASGSYTPEQKRLLKYRTRSLALWSQLRTFVGTGMSFTSRGLNYTVTFDSALAATHGHASPCFVLPDGTFVLYVVLLREGVQIFPTAQRSQPLMVTNAPFTDSAGNENPLQAARDILAGM